MRQTTYLYARIMEPFTETKEIELPPAAEEYEIGYSRIRGDCRHFYLDKQHSLTLLLLE